MIRIVLTALFLLPVTAQAAIVWKLEKKDGQPHLFALPTAEESDFDFWALCKKGGVIEIGIGADTNVGKGDGEPVTVTLKSGGKEAKIEGRSIKSENYEMTAASELRTQAKAGDPLFAVLSAGAPISVTGSIEKPAKWQVSGLKAKVAAFLARCK